MLFLSPDSVDFKIIVYGVSPPVFSIEASILPSVASFIFLLSVISVSSAVISTSKLFPSISRVKFPAPKRSSFDTNLSDCCIS